MRLRLDHRSLQGPFCVLDSADAETLFFPGICRGIGVCRGTSERRMVADWSHAPRRLPINISLRHLALDTLPPTYATRTRKAAPGKDARHGIAPPPNADRSPFHYEERVLHGHAGSSSGPKDMPSDCTQAPVTPPSRDGARLSCTARKERVLLPGSGTRACVCVRACVSNFVSL